MNGLEIHHKGKGRVLVIGAAGLDIIGRLSASPEPGSSIPAEVKPSFGGVARNVAENLAHLGLSVDLISAVGDDPFGKQLLDHTSSAGVDINSCMLLHNAHTASYLAVLGPDGKLDFALDDMQILNQITPDFVNSLEGHFEQADLIFMDANLNPKTMRTVFKLAQKAHVPVCADATSVKLASKLIPFLKRLFLLTANTYESTVLVNHEFVVSDRQSAVQAARYLVNQGVNFAFIPMAEFGVCYATSETSGHIPAIKTTIVGSTGAGDALTATILFGLLNDISIDEAVRLGVTAASLTLRHPATVVPDLSLEKLYDHLVI